MNSFLKSIILLIYSGAFLFILLWTSYTIDAETKTISLGKCYDRYGSELIGQECIIKDRPYAPYSNLLVLTGVIGFLVGLFISSLYFLEWINGKEGYEAKE